MKYRPVPFLLLSTLAALPAQSPPPAPRAPVLNVFEVRDLLQTSPGAEAAPQLDAAGQALGELLRRFLPDAETNPPLELRAVRGALITRLDPEQAQWLERVLARQREAATSIVHVEARAVAGLRADHPLLGEDSAPRALDGEQAVAELLRSLQAESGVRLLPAQRLDLTPCTPAQVESLKHVSYLKEWHVQRGVEPGNRTILDPVVDVARAGTILRGTALLLPDGRVGLELGFTLIDLELPIRTGTIRLEGQTLEIGHPRATTTRIDASVTLPLRRTLLLSTPRAQDRGTLLLVTVTGIDPPR
jgi:hypothetical protein